MIRANGIISMLKEVSVGVYHFEMGILFRTSLLINGILFNTEAMLSLTDKHISLLEESDKYLLRQLFETDMGTPIESLYIETASLPVKFILKGRRLMYYWSMLQKNETEIAKQVFLAQKEFPSKKTDWVKQVYEDLEYCTIEHSEEEIKCMKQDTYTNLVDRKIRTKASEYLTMLQMKHNKSMYLYQDQKMAEYLRTDLLSVREKHL